MRVPENRFKQRLAGGDRQFGLWLGIPDATAAEICAQSPYDWLLIDAEHAPFSLEKVQELLRTLAPYQAAPVVRPVSGDRDLLKRFLDIGAQTLLIPMVDTAEQAETIVRALHYPPRGNRGLGTSLARAARWNKVENYLQKASEEICLLLQIETLEGLHNLSAICRIPEVDGIFIGPSDLSAALGHPGDAGHPEVVTAIDGALETIHAGGKRSGILSLSPRLTRHYMDKGVSFIGLGVDTLLLSRAAGALLAEYTDEGTPAPSGDEAGY